MRAFIQNGLALLVGLGIAACAAPTRLPQPTVPALSPAPTPLSPTLSVPTLEVVIPTNPPQECGAEAAIALAQTQSDLSLAADGKVESLRVANADSLIVAQLGVDEFSLARDLMRAYFVPDCLLQAKVFADQFFGERIDAYHALAAGDQSAYETHLTNGEIARQNMITVVNGVLEP
jgi:hypothetical protein